MSQQITNEQKISSYKKFQTLDAEVQELKRIYNDQSANRTKLFTQLQENKMVLSEFSHCKEDSKIYKMVGPVIVNVDFLEAKSNVEKRIQFIEKELKKIEINLKENQQKQDDKIKELQGIQEWFLKLQQLESGQGQQVQKK